MLFVPPTLKSWLCHCQKPTCIIVFRKFGNMIEPKMTNLIFFVHTRNKFLFVFLIDVLFRSEKHWRPFDATERGSVDDNNADMKTVTYDRSPIKTQKYVLIMRTAIIVAVLIKRIVIMVTVL